MTAQAAKLVAPELAQRPVSAHVYVLRGARDGDPLCKASWRTFKQWYPGRSTMAARALKAEDSEGRARLRAALNGDDRQWQAFVAANRQAAEQVVEAATREVAEAGGNGRVTAAKAEKTRINKQAKAEAAMITGKRAASQISDLQAQVEKSRRDTADLQAQIEDMAAAPDPCYARFKGIVSGYPPRAHRRSLPAQSRKQHPPHRGRCSMT